MITSSRRAFLGGMGSSMVAVGLGAPLAARRGLALARGEDDLDALSFGELEPLAALMQETSPGKLQPILIEKLRSGTELRTLVAAAALANARTFGGEDYTGYHCQMALMPAYEMSKELPAASRPLPVLKVIYRNGTRIQENGGRRHEVLHALPSAVPASREEGVRRLRAALVQRDVEAAESAFAELSQHGPRSSYDDLQAILRENLDVHRVVLAWRAWEVLPRTGDAHAQTLLRQSVRFCVEAEDDRVRRGRPEPRLRTLMPELLERFRLGQEPPGTRRASDEELKELSLVVFSGEKEEAARAVAEALAAGLSQEDVGEALSLAGNELLLHDPGRSERQASRGKPAGSVHGASVGVHASDAARAWRNIAGVSNPVNAMASLVAGAYHTAGQSGYVGRRRFAYEQHLDGLGDLDRDELLRRTRAAIESGDQARACALVHGYGELGCPERPMFDLLLEYALSEDGALHAEKYYRTVCEEFSAARPAFRWRQLVALGRVTASQYGYPAPGYAAACEELGV